MLSSSQSRIQCECQVVWLDHITVGVRSDVPSPLGVHAAVFATGELLYR